MSRPAEDTSSSDAPRYDFAVTDLEAESVHGDVARLVGENRRVLELGPATGYMSAAFKARGCSVVGIELDPEMAERAAEHLERVIVGDLDEIDLDAELGDDRFDVIVAADVLEHLVDPLAVLRRLTPFLAEGGTLVASVPNVAHGSIRLALLQGRFDYRDIGLLDRTHKTFFTRESLERMLDEADLGLVVLHRHDLVFDASEVPFDAAGVPGEVRRRLDEDPDARTYQFVVQALPMAQPGMRALQERMREQAGARADVELQRDDLALALEHARAEADELGAAIAKLTGREGELRRALIEANDALLEREAEIDLLRREVGRVSELRSGDQAWSGEQAKAIEQQVGQIRDLNVQLRRYRRTSVLGVAGRARSWLARARG
ncbi:methyltransferase domain-containing protein [Baekduia sp. Peel2402]|uniref:methyltransferase domain-containing protein n=1 Tax=Baekduia sp. Peel2402 TaxID=3458296 RepID=UPI00403E448E